MTKILRNRCRKKIHMPHQVNPPIVARRGNFFYNITNNGEEFIKFFRRTTKIFCREQIEGDAVDAINLTAPLQHFYNFQSTCTVSTRNVSETSFPCPATISIAHNGNVGGLG